jgi:hypothetical protein
VPLAEALSRAGATDVQAKRKDANTEYERQDRVACVYKGRAYELDIGLVRQHGGVGK